MITRNGIAGSAWSNNISGGYKLISVNGVIASGLNFRYLVANNLSFQFGNGVTPPTVNDIALESPVSGITILNITSSANDVPNQADGFSFFATVTVKNNSGADIVVSEIGTYVTANGSAYMLTRDTFPPFNVADGHTYTFSITIQ